MKKAVLIAAMLALNSIPVFAFSPVKFVKSTAKMVVRTPGALCKSTYYSSMAVGGGLLVGTTAVVAGTALGGVVFVAAFKDFVTGAY